MLQPFNLSRYPLTIRTFLVCTGLAAILLLGACGGDDNSDGGGGDGNVTAVPTRSAEDGGDDDGEDGGDGDSTAIPTRPDDGGDDDGAATSDIDACSLLEISTVNIVLDTTISGGVRQDFGGFASCRWEDAQRTSFIQVDVIKGDRDSIEPLFEANQNEEVDAGVGEAAKWRSLTSALEVIDGEYDVVIQVVEAEENQDQRLETAKALAFRVLGALHGDF